MNNSTPIRTLCEWCDDQWNHGEPDFLMLAFSIFVHFAVMTLMLITTVEHSVGNESITQFHIAMSVLAGATYVGFILYGVGYDALCNLVRYATANEVHLDKIHPKLTTSSGGLAYASAVFMSIAIILPLLLSFTWKIIVPLVIIGCMGWGLVYCTRRAFLLKRRLNQHINDRGVHEKIESESDDVEDFRRAA